MLQRPAQRDDAGLTLIEVMVALLVFTIVATGIIASMGTITRMTTDDRARVTAENLAAQEVDIVRAVSDPFTVVNKTTVYPVDGRNYTIKRSVSWVSSAGTDVACNVSTSILDLRVNVRVTWPGMLTTTPAVQDDTVVAPAGRISDTSSGSIHVYVQGVGAVPQANVGVTLAVPTGSTGKVPNTQPKATNSDGCTYANELTPGTYTVTLKKAGTITSDQVDGYNTGWTGTVQVTAGGTTSPSNPLFDTPATVTTTYAAYPATTSSTSSFLLPSSSYGTTPLNTTWTNTSGTWATTPSSQGAAVTRFPYASGYGVIAGDSPATGTTCAATDPQAWSAGTSNGKRLSAGVRATAATAAGGTSSVAVPVGVALVKAPAGYFLGAVPATPQSGNPSCAITSTTYVFGPATGGFQSVALPYGSWRFVYGTSTSNYYTVPAANIQVQTNAAGGGVATDGTTTFDPRQLAP